jgi:eukaryotic-like serine/threonine-protein kinase
LTTYKPGDVIHGKYEIGARLGTGGMGTVFAARHLELGELVALKFLFVTPDDAPGSVDRFLQEARAGMRIKSPHVARVYDVGTEADGPFIVMEHLQGRDLSKVLDERGQMPIGESADLLLQACEAINEAHALGIVHRDLKPANLFVITGADGADFVKVLDFGIAKVPSPEGPSLTATRGVVGTSFYMSPEQLTASGKVDARSDVWSLGVVLYEMLADTVPFPGGTPPEIHAAILRGGDVKLSEHRDDVPAELDALISHALQRDREARIPSVAAFAACLAPFGGEIARESLARIQRVAGRSRTPASVPPAVAPPSEASVPTREHATRAVTSPEDVPTATVGARRWTRIAPLAAAGVALVAAVAVGLHARESNVLAPAPSSAAAAAPACNGTATPECEAACTAHAPGACEALATALTKGAGAPRDVPRAATLYEAACNQGSFTACNGLGALYGRGDGIPQDNKQAVKFYTQACDGGYGRGCVNLGAMHFDGTGVPKDEMVGANLFQRGCENGEPLGCLNASVAYRTGRGLSKNMARSLTLAARACDGGVSAGCIAPSVAKITGEGVTKDVAIGLGELDGMCTAKNADACSRLATLYDNGSPDVTADRLLGREYDKKACDLGSKTSCMRREAHGTMDMSNSSGARGEALLAEQCEAGVKSACGKVLADAARR